jgi:lactate dehydrogenase-like 2-hydroxyacid dehydrogenase
MTIGVLALVGVTPDRVATLTAAGYAVHEGKHYTNRTDAIRAAATTVQAVLTNGRGGLSGDEMALLPKLEIVCAMGAGSEAVDLATARRRGIVVAHCPDANAPAVADSAMLLLAVTRHLLEADRFVRIGGWQEHWRVETPTITGKRLGLLGLGRIGSRIAQRAACGFAMEIGYHTRAAVAGAPYRYFASLLELATWAARILPASRCPFRSRARPELPHRGDAYAYEVPHRHNRRVYDRHTVAAWPPAPYSRGPSAGLCPRYAGLCVPAQA